ncbi:hypothetical protein BT69DRAFT_1281054 [Atractiella rhizophila]|nr:hypothetical protein BT69DRAFT_1281054 [Atractiella rhizophila]
MYYRACPNSTTPGCSNRTGGRPPPSKRLHRDVSPPRRRDDGYDMVFDVGDSYGREKKGRKNDGGRDSDRRRRRSRSRSPPPKPETDRHRDRDRERDVRRHRGGERQGYREDRDRDRGERGGRERIGDDSRGLRCLVTWWVGFYPVYTYSNWFYSALKATPSVTLVTVIILRILET